MPSIGFKAMGHELEFTVPTTRHGQSRLLADCYRPRDITADGVAAALYRLRLRARLEAATGNDGQQEIGFYRG